MPEQISPAAAPPQPTPMAQQQQSKGSLQDVAGAANGQGNISPELQHKMDVYNTALMHIMHNPKTSGNIVEMLKAAPPDQSITTTALQLTKTVSQSFEKKGEKVEDSVKLCGAMYLVSDLSEIGNTAGLWEQEVTNEQIGPLLTKVATKYIHSGLKDKSIDPIELQEQAQDLFSDKQKEVGGVIQKKLGLPDEPTVSMGVDAYAQKKSAPLEQENAELRQQLQQLSAAQQQQQQGGAQ